MADALAAGVHDALPGATVLTCPVSDGGDGLLDAVLPPGSLRESVTVTGPLGAPVAATLGWIDADTAIFESASACGLALVPRERRDPLRATSRGVGELIREAADRGARTIIVGLGGSATVDGGTGAARGLGWSFRDREGAALAEGGGALADLGEYDGGWPIDAAVVALVDVTVPLTGDGGAARVFAPQKGATPDQVERLERGLARLAEVMALHGRPELATAPGGGAAGGLGAGLACFARASLVPGAPWMLDRVGFDAALAKADLVLTGEGVFDATSLAGKATGAVITRAGAARRPAVVIAGRAALEHPGVTVAAGDGATLGPAELAALAARATRTALGLPAA